MAENEKISSLISQIFQLIPESARITRVEFEGPKIAIYTQNLAYFMENSYVIPQIVNMLKKHVVVKADESLRKEEEYAREYLSRIIPREADVAGMYFDGIQGEIVIELRNPSAITDEVRESIEKFGQEMGWKIKIRRIIAQPPATYQEITHLNKMAEEDRLQFLRSVGSKIFRERLNLRKDIVITFLGGAAEVGRSSLLLTTNESKVLLDCGVNLGVSEKSGMFPRFDLFEVDVDDLDAVVLTHAHLDHSGFVPVLFKYGYRGPVYCTEPTLALSVMLLNDAIKVAEAEGKQLYYDSNDVKEFILHCITLPYNSVTDIAPDIKLTLSNAGHILGSAIAHLHIGQGLFNLVYTGDYKFDRSRLFQPANYMFPRVEALVTESTYGDRNDVMPSREEAENRLVSEIANTVNSGGKVLIPIPAVGRAQEIFLVLNEHIARNEMPDVPIYIEGMLGEATRLHLIYPEFMNKEIRDKIVNNGENPFITERYTIISHPRDREEVFSRGPSIIIATSGMLEGGPSVAYFSRLAEDERNKVVFVSYQVSGTLGRRVLDGAKDVNIAEDGGKIRNVHVRASVVQVEGFSGHSDYNQLMSYISRFRGRVQRVIVVHGEQQKAYSLAESVNRLFRRYTATVPQVGEAIRLY